MTNPDRGLFAERGARPRSRSADTDQGRQGDAAAPASAPAAPVPPADSAEVLRDVRQGVRATVDEWLSERSHTVSLAVAQVVEDALMTLQASHSARIREISAAYEERIASLDRERAEAVRGAMRRRRARLRAVETELRERIERLERALTEASLETLEKLREVERRETERRLQAESEWKQALRDKDDEIARLRRGGGLPEREAGSPADDRLDTLAEQLRSRRPGGHEH